MIVVLGIDPSLTGLGLCSGPSDFDFTWSRVHATCLGRPGKKSDDTATRLRRVRDLAEDVCKYAKQEHVERVWIEGQIASGRAFNVPQLCELIGVLRHMLLERCGLVAELAPQTSVRKLLLGWLPPRDRKAAVVEALKAQNITLRDGLPPRDTDAYDALATWNWGLHELAAPCLTNLLGPKPVKPKSRRRKGVATGQAVLGMAGGGAR